MKKEIEKIQASTVLEGMTSISALLNSDCGNTRIIEHIWVAVSKKRSKSAEIGFLTSKSKELGFDLSFVSDEQIAAEAIGNTHGGIIAFCSDRQLPILTADVIRDNGFYVYLEGIEDPYNFGYTLRSLYAAGIDGVVLPERNWMTAAGVVARASAGTSELMPLFTANADTVIATFRAKQYQILCAGIRDSVSVFDEDFQFPLLLVIGGEKRGISRNLLDQADKIVRIDYGRSFRGSLSAASAATVMAFEIFRKNKSPVDR